MGLLDLLEDGIGLAGGEDVPRQVQDRDLIGCCRSGRRDHIGRTGSDRGGAGHDLLPFRLLGESHGSVAHALLVPALVHLKFPRILFKCLPEAKDIPMSEDGEDSFDESLFPAVELDILGIQELH